MIRSNMTKWINNAWVWLKKPVAGIPKWGWAVLATVVLVLIALFWDWIWCWLRYYAWNWLREGVENESYGDTLRNLILILAGPLGLGLAIWRGITADRQAKLTQRGLMDERYQKGADMLGSKVFSTRIGGIHALKNLDRDDSEEYHIRIMVLFCAFLQHPVTDSLQPEMDIQNIITVIRKRGKKERKLEKKKGFRIDLSLTKLEHADLRCAYLSCANLKDVNLMLAKLNCADLTGADLTNAELNRACLQRAKLKGAILKDAKLHRADLTDADLTNAKLENAYLEGAKLGDAKGLTQAMLDEAEPSRAPDLATKDGRLPRCAKTNVHLTWRNLPTP